MTHVTVTAEQWDQLMWMFAHLAIIAGVAFMALTADFWHWLDRIRWHRRRRARLARRRAKARAA
jgi:uncharacterized protein (DUF2062 family)